ncbi:MAG: excinuclease ABC subunit UvrC [Lachnospiraceae bacterium]|nr:excinuclease ABC subunit UvrC [Lachnospiraceae bacterium]
MERSDVFDIEEELKKLPSSPGVYLMHDAGGVIIYIGKAISLKNRVRQYFQSSRNKSPKILKMVSLIKWFEYIVTDSELEALVLESNLIKEYRPKYNTMLKDDKNYPYIRVTLEEEYPRILYSHTMKKDKSKYYGPYTSGEAVRNTIKLLHKLYRLRTCNKNLPREQGTDRPCLNFHMKQCQAPCQGYITKEEYARSVSKALDFLNGKSFDRIAGELEEKMQKAAEEMDFEAAANYRDLLFDVRKIAEKQKVTDSGLEDRDIIALAIEGEDAVCQVFFVREGRLIGRDHFHLAVAIGDTPVQVLTEFVKQFYSGTPFVPRELFLPFDIEERELIENWLGSRRGQKVTLRVPKKGEKHKLVELAERNARMILGQNKEKMKREAMRTTGAVKEITELLGLSGIVRVEAFDISNISGFESVGSMVVFENGRPKRNDYRKFKIKWVKGPNDYASMDEVLTRRFSHGIKERKQLRQEMAVQPEEQAPEEQAKKVAETSTYGSFTRFPDLIMMDGGKGQVNIALAVLDRLQLHIPVCGMVKDDRHRTRGLYFNGVELPIDTHSEGFRLITRIQDEAHRFAIEYHRSLRSKGQVHSVLDDIPGIGPARRKALMRTFASLDEVRAATVEELQEIPEMNRRSAESVWKFFHAEDIPVS